MKTKKIVSIMLCLFLLLTTVLVPMPQSFAVEPSVEIVLNDEKIETLTLEENEKEVLSASVQGFVLPSYQWQILLNEETEIWVDILDRDEKTCEVSNALVKHMFDDADSAYIRCKVAKGNNVTYSKPVCVSVNALEEDNPQVTAYAQTRYVETVKDEEEPAEEVKQTPRLFKLSRETTEYVHITVKYLDYASMEEENVESAIYSPYTATIEKGTEFKQNVVSPTFIGFAPYWNGEWDGTIGGPYEDDATTLQFNMDSVTEDITISVYYKPILVNYAIKYFFQNMNDDLYTEDVSRYHTDQAITGEIIGNDILQKCAGNTTGFTKMYHIPESVAADGSTVFECYYDRNYYLVQFDLDGGYGVDPIYARYGSAFLVNKPVKHGYVFGGWDELITDTNSDGKPDTGDGSADVLPSAIPSKNTYYKALWNADDTEYTVVYWLQNGTDSNGDAKYDYLGSRSVPESSGERVSGGDDLGTAKICGVEEHSHSVGNGCYGNCTATEHTHGLSCYTTSGLNRADSQTGNTLRAYDALKAAATTPIAGNVYKYNYQYRYYNFFYYDDTWYYLGTNNTYTPITVVGNMGNPARNAFTTAAASMNCSGSSHTHTTACLSCTTTEHTHNDNCEIDATYYIYVTADKNVLVEGDGSTVVNVYYKPKEYTFKFYYAFENVTDATYWVIGGTTYYFGGGKDAAPSTGTDTNSEIALLRQYLDGQKSNIGQVDELPKLNQTGASRNYTLGYDDKYNGSDITYNGDKYRFHYISFTADYGQDISKLWPCSVFQSVTRTKNNTHGKWNGTEAFVSAWNGEYNVWYSRHHDGNPAGEDDNQTIKGNQEKLDYQMLFETEPVGYDNVVAYTCFWENGADIGWSIPELYVYKIWVPVVAGDLVNPNDTTTIDGKAVVTEDGVTYKLLASYDTCDDSDVNHQTQPTLEGYTAYKRTSELAEFDNTVYSEGYIVNFFYTAEENSLVMRNHGNDIVNMEVPFGTTLSSLAAVDQLDENNNYAPAYPSTLEENAYHFGGWYTTEKCLPGTEFDMANGTMPSRGLMLYANWVPETHTVNFFSTYDEMLEFEDEDDETVTPYLTKEVVHGNVVGSVTTPTKDDVQSSLSLVFAGWFYMENGEKKAYSPLDMPINSDVNLFAEWSSFSPQPYKITYIEKKNNESDPTVKVAEDTTGYAYGGSTRTFVAKAGDPYNQLYDAYNKGWFPTVGSHSITIQAEEDFDNPTLNVFEFEYVHAENVSYTVRYVNKKTGELLAVEEGEQNPELKSTNSAVVTERFKVFPNMVPDAFYKRLVLEVKEDENGNYVGTENNVITFYYTPNDTNAYYAVHFMLEKLGATDAEKKNYDIYGNGGYEEASTHIEGIGEVGNTAYITPQTMNGFTLIAGDDVDVPIAYYPPATAGGTATQSKATEHDGTYGLEITSQGSELYLFYSRNDYPYEVHHYKYNTEELVDPDNHPSEFGNAPYGSSLNRETSGIEGYTCVSSEEQTITIRQDENGTNHLNKIIFYYSPRQYVVEYIPVLEDGGTLSKTIEVIAGNETLEGSTPTANQYYEFKGWFLDEECTDSVGDEGTVTEGTNHLMPTKNKLSDKNRNRFYAKFELQASDLTIERKDSAKDGQVYVYKIVNNDTHECYYVTIEGGADPASPDSKSVTIKNLPHGSYTITQQNDWTWRYADSAKTVNHQPKNSETTTVNFNGDFLSKWLNGNSPLRTNRKAGN